MLRELRLVKDELDLNDWQIETICAVTYQDKACSGCKHVHSVRICDGSFVWYCSDDRRVGPYDTCDSWIQEEE